MKKLLIAGLLALFPSLAWGQCTGIFPANTLCGNLSGSPGPPAAFSASSSLTGPGSAAVNDLVLWANVGGTQLKDGTGQTIPGTYTWSGAATFNAAATFTSSLTATGLITLADLASLGANTVIGSVAGGTPIALSQAQLMTMLSYTIPLTNGVARSVISKLQETPSITDFGAKCDGSTDDTTAITNAIAAVPSGSSLLIPAASCKVSGGFTITKPVVIQGIGPASTIIGTLGAGVDLFHVFPNGVSLHKVWFQDLTIAITGGKNAINFDSTQAASSFIAESGARRVNTLGSASLAGASISVIGSGLTSYPFDLSFEDNELTSGTGTALTAAAMYFNNAGDTLRVVNGEITGTGYGLFLAQVAGAGNFIMSGGMNFTACGGIFVSGSIFPVFRDMELEIAPSCVDTGFTGFAILVSSANAFSPTFDSDNITLDAGATGYSGAISINTATDARMTNLKVVNAITGSTTGITTAAGSTGATYGPSVLATGFTVNYSDSGTSTTHVSTAAGHP
jgi:Pectate lyase superfamily protein